MKKEKNKNPHQLKISPWKTLGIFAVVALVIAIIFYFTLGSLSWPPSWQDYVILGTWVLLTTIYGILSMFANYYTYNKRELVRHLFKKEYVLPFDEILYIDEEWSVKHNTILVYTSRGHERFLPHDKEHKLYKLIIERADKRISRDEYIRRFPKTKVR